MGCPDYDHVCRILAQFQTDVWRPPVERIGVTGFACDALIISSVTNVSTEGEWDSLGDAL